VRNGCSLGWRNIADTSPFTQGSTLNSIVEEGKGSVQLQATRPELSESARYGDPDPNMKNSARLDPPRDGLSRGFRAGLERGLAHSCRSSLRSNLCWVEMIGGS
jgi:hypothetical protein